MKKPTPPVAKKEMTVATLEIHDRVSVKDFREFFQSVLEGLPDDYWICPVAPGAYYDGTCYNEKHKIIVSGMAETENYKDDLKAYTAKLAEYMKWKKDRDARSKATRSRRELAKAKRDKKKAEDLIKKLEEKEKV